MKNFEKLFIGALLGFAFPFLFALLGVLTWFYVSKDETYALYSLLAGLSIGMVIDLFFLKRWIISRYNLSTELLVFIFIIYNIGIYGMFMGFPFFNLIMGFVAGYYFGKRLLYQEIEEMKIDRQIKSVSLFTSLFMALLCGCTAYLVFREKSFCINLRPMLGINFQLNWGLIKGITIIGGIFLIITQYFTTKLMIQKQLKSGK